MRRMPFLRHLSRICRSEWLARTGEVDDIEDTMLEMTDVEREDNSRLSCQITASADLDGLVLYVPEPE